VVATVLPAIDETAALLEGSHGTRYELLRAGRPPRAATAGGRWRTDRGGPLEWIAKGDERAEDQDTKNDGAP